mmetsp:Transcript_2268/g.6775  ORF Transcript_2268/g.6775 Transcript_2268/m.6775 type:complete len:538 (-) Transcript_2268:32-1645(-)
MLAKENVGDAAENLGEQEQLTSCQLDRVEEDVGAGAAASAEKGHVPYLAGPEELVEPVGDKQAQNGSKNVKSPEEKLAAGECPLKDEYTRRTALSREEVDAALKGANIQQLPIVDGELDKQAWRDSLAETEKNFLRHDFRKELRKKKVHFERFEKYQKEGQTDGSLQKQVDIRGKVILAPLTTVGNLPFRRLCKRMGADVTVGEMAVAEHVLKGESDDWALLRRHKSEDIFGVQLAGSLSDIVAKTTEMISNHCDVDFIDLNVGCPIDLVCKKGAGCELMKRPDRLRGVVRKGSAVSTLPFSVKMRTGISNNPSGWNAHKIIPKVKDWGASWITLHGRSKEQRYRRNADWQYIERCAKLAHDIGLPLVGNGDIFSFEDAEEGLKACDAIMVARGALIKPWIFTEIKESRYIDVTPSERLEMYREFCSYGLDHYGADKRGREITRRYLLEWLCFTCRYPPVGIFERAGERLHELRPRMNLRFNTAIGRDHLEMTLSSRDPTNWIKISELFLGPVPSDFNFQPKHVSSAWSEGGMAVRG